MSTVPTPSAADGAPRRESIDPGAPLASALFGFLYGTGRAEW